MMFESPKRQASAFVALVCGVGLFVAWPAHPSDDPHIVRVWTGTPEGGTGLTHLSACPPDEAAQRIYSGCVEIPGTREVRLSEHDVARLLEAPFAPVCSCPSSLPVTNVEDGQALLRLAPPLGSDFALALCVESRNPLTRRHIELRHRFPSIGIEVWYPCWSTRPLQMATPGGWNP